MQHGISTVKRFGLEMILEMEKCYYRKKQLVGMKEPVALLPYSEHLAL